MPKRTIKTRILILSDTHAAVPGSSNSKIPFHQPLPWADVLLHAGDLTLNGSLTQHQNAIDLIHSVDAPLKIVIPGNHDVTLDREYYSQYPTDHGPTSVYSDDQLDEIRQMYDSPTAREEGIYYVEEGIQKFRLENGARLNVYASAYQPEFFNWAFGYKRSTDRYNSQPGTKNPVPDHHAPARHGNGDAAKEPEIDIMLTHGPPQGILDLTSANESVGCQHLRRAVERCLARLHCFGHIHESWGAIVKRWDGMSTKKTWKGVNEQRDNSDRGGFNTDKRNPNMYYQDLSFRTRVDGETLLDPGTYEDQKSKMGAYIDMTGLEAGKETVFVNASVMSLGYKPLNAPWVVDVELPVADPGDDDHGQ
ncbi:serine/threonine protein phosphatase [Exophiala viscosa]|uniref:Serine/threonine protein phosphatase n=1 Tax=Exophiala viscosa TaxID=2486360 RepID=A0AAN6DW00_9EURO|nr:serine/threonine protein phosphatase [Exophiala viscosa]KAI1626211.1 serine/threonine protein phosphatase [Exophiala viscosa]